MRGVPLPIPAPKRQSSVARHCQCVLGFSPMCTETSHRSWIASMDTKVDSRGWGRGGGTANATTVFTGACKHGRFRSIEQSSVALRSFNHAESGRSEGPAHLGFRWSWVGRRAQGKAASCSYLKGRVDSTWYTFLRCPGHCSAAVGSPPLLLLLEVLWWGCAR
jgi:hypothetical protein